MANRSKSLLTTISTGYTHNDKPVIPEYVSDRVPGSIKSTISTGFEHDDKPVVEPPKEVIVGPESFPESVKESIDIGYDNNNQLHTICPEPQLIQYLIKQNYLSEFKEETEKQLARTNLGVYSKQEVDKIANQLVLNIAGEFITKNEFNYAFDQLDYVDSTLKARVAYNIPESLFVL